MAFPLTEDRLPQKRKAKVFGTFLQKVQQKHPAVERRQEHKSQNAPNHPEVEESSIELEKTRQHMRTHVLHNAKHCDLQSIRVPRNNTTSEYT